MTGRPYREQAVRNHHQRLERIKRAPDATPELASAWRSLQLHWLRTIPSYRQEIQERVLEAHRAYDARFGRNYCMECGGSLEVGRYTAACGHCMNRLSRYRREQRRNGDVDRLGQEIEGCG